MCIFWRCDSLNTQSTTEFDGFEAMTVPPGQMSFSKAKGNAFVPPQIFAVLTYFNPRSNEKIANVACYHFEG